MQSLLNEIQHIHNRVCIAGENTELDIELNLENTNSAIMTNLRLWEFRAEFWLFTDYLRITLENGYEPDNDFDSSGRYWSKIIKFPWYK